MQSMPSYPLPLFLFIKRFFSALSLAKKVLLMVTLAHFIVLLFFFKEKRSLSFKKPIVVHTVSLKNKSSVNNDRSVAAVSPVTSPPPPVVDNLEKRGHNQPLPKPTSLPPPAKNEAEAKKERLKKEEKKRVAPLPLVKAEKVAPAAVKADKIEPKTAPKKTEVKKTEVKKAEPKKITTPKVAAPSNAASEQQKLQAASEQQKLQATKEQQKLKAAKERQELIDRAKQSLQESLQESLQKMQQTPSPSSQRERISGQAKQKVSQSSSFAAAVSALSIESLNTESLNRAGDAHSTAKSSYLQQVDSFLRKNLSLPELGAVKVELVLLPNGSVQSVNVLQAESARNKDYVLKHVPLLKFPSFAPFLGSQERYQLAITFENDL